MAFVEVQDNMNNTGKLYGCTIFITGASRGIGLAIARKCARDGANIVIAAKTDKAHPKLPGTIYTAARQIESEGGKCLPCVVDVRSEHQIQSAVDAAVKTFGGIDILVNNASAIHLAGTEEVSVKKYDLMTSINTRGSFMCSKFCYPHLKKGRNPHILNISPPLNRLDNRDWFGDHPAYSVSKFNMTLYAMAMASEFKVDGIAVNTLWPKTPIYTAAVANLFADKIPLIKQVRTCDIVADAAYAILIKESQTFTGGYYLDEDVLQDEGIEDLHQYSFDPKNKTHTSQL